jgi:hypothetical protein
MRSTRPLIAATAVLTATVCAAGCGGSATTGHPRTAASTQTTVARVVTVPDHAQRTTSLRAVQQAAIPAAYASWLSYYDGSIWVKRDDGRVIRVDPHTNKQTGQVGFYTDGQHYCQGIGAGGGAVWSCQQGFITRIDPKTVKIIARIPIAKAFDEGRYVFADGRIWVITGTNGNQLVGIDPATNQPGPPITLPYSCTDLAPGGDAVWVLCPNASHVVKVDITRRRVAGTVAIDSAYNGYATRSDLWVGSNSDLVRINATTFRPEAIFHNAGPGQGGDVTVDGNHVWVSTNNGPLYLIDATTNTITEHITPPAGLGGGALIATTDSIWVTAENIGTLLRLRSP